ncbi:assimilatory sulfite reductase (NADPH) hemoprotein subunit [Paraferrimonas sedimenticola]|uniref:Sulfite reductase [NADPH] hemoprotein beta-component n=1 Tax=Paraferrimonas sedimenticola TaxID=375674 RepID=A0AA37RTW9_9GAMM|nr:assimilatory sulfite reductase (NADPH) hemoprotein subunit [Paraferrimonas sedimenticola]GLP95660.1 sulfite reductase [NADPH] hemoprotein beta-component [Paraferrimonas sedimenticola]
MADKQESQRPLAANEGMKTKSRHLRGSIEHGLADGVTGSFNESDQQMIKFHGFYQQDDRDERAERQAQKLEPHYSFMLRARVPGGVCTPEQWLALDDIAAELTSYHSIRLTTRQTFQYHGIAKRNIKALIQGLDKAGLDSIAACGDVNRNVMCNPNPLQSSLHQQVYPWAVRLSEDLLPKTQAYAEIWLDKEKIFSNQQDEVEPMYGDTYLPRKFKTAVAIPPHNDVDVYTNDLGFIAIAHGDELAGFNVSVGGGMGSTHGDVNTFPRLADVLGFVEPEQAMDVAKAVITTQRDWGNRHDRKRARLKYTIEDKGLDNFKAEVERRAGVKFGPARPVNFDSRGDRFGWHKGTGDSWHLTLYLENGRIVDKPDLPMRSGLRAIAKVHKGDFRMTSSQNLMIANVPESEKEAIQALAQEYGLYGKSISATRGQSMACVALPTCPLAMAEAERYLPDFLTQVEALQARHQVAEQPIVVRITGCPNGCARPFAAEIGLVGKAEGRYNLYLGASHVGTRLNKMVLENETEEAILAHLDPLMAQYAAERNPGEAFGDFVIRSGAVAPVYQAATDFHG